MRQAPYEVLADWHEEHEGNLRIILPDTYGTEGFLRGAPDWLAGWTGIRIDSGDPAEGAEAAIRWWKERGEDPRRYALLLSGGAAPMHACGIARLLGLTRVVCPPGAGVASAIGMLVTPPMVAFSRSYVARLDTIDWRIVHDLFDDLRPRTCLLVYWLSRWWAAECT